MKTLLIAGFLMLNTLVFAQEEHQFQSVEATDETLTDLINAQENDPQSLKANYNLASHFYNEGVEELENLNYDNPNWDNEAVIREAKSWFKEAVPYAEKAYQINPKHPETLNMLSGIYFGLNDIEKSDAFKKQYAEVLDQQSAE